MLLLRPTGTYGKQVPNQAQPEQPQQPQDWDRQGKRNNNRGRGNPESEPRTGGKPPGPGISHGRIPGPRPTNHSHESTVQTLSLKYTRGEHIILNLEIKFTKRSIKTTAMIDSGATAMFIDQEFCNVHHLPLQKKVKPQSVYVVDGEPIRSGPITHECQIPVSIGRHHETVTFQVTTLGQHPMILGLPWLKKHNPEIEWSTHQVMFKSQYCQEQCLEESPIVKAPREESAIQQFVRTMPVTPHREQRKLQLSSITTSKSASLAAEAARANKQPTDPRTIVPREYHNLLQLFPVKEATEPPPRRGIDHRIELLPNETQPFKALYNLSGN